MHDAAEVLAELESLGTAQNRKVYGRHGVSGEMYGVSFAQLRKLGKALHPENELARALWDSGNHDARVLATLVADASAMTLRELDRWAAQSDNYVLGGMLASLVVRGGRALERFERWSASRKEFTAQAGWALLASLCSNTDVELDDAFLRAQLARIEREIHGAKNRVRYAMNNALIAIGARSDALAKAAIAAV